MTPVTSQTPCSRAISPSRSAAGPGTSTDCSASRAKAPVVPRADVAGAVLRYDTRDAEAESTAPVLLIIVMDPSVPPKQLTFLAFTEALSADAG